MKKLLCEERILLPLQPFPCVGFLEASRQVSEKTINILFTKLAWAILQKTVPSVLSITLGLQPWAVFKT